MDACGCHRPRLGSARHGFVYLLGFKRDPFHLEIVLFFPEGRRRCGHDDGKGGAVVTGVQSCSSNREPEVDLTGVSARRCILLVNDDEDSLFLLSRSVRKALPEADLVSMSRSVEALRFAQSHPIAAVVTDNRMPEMDGLTLVRRIRETDAHVPILMVTGSMDVAAAAAEAGANACLSWLSWAGIGEELRNLLLVQ